MKMKVLFLANRESLDRSRFVRNDLEILSRHFQVRPISKQESELFPVFLARLFRGLLVSDVCYVWFSGWAALYAALFGRIAGTKCVIVPGGFDVADIPQLRYGYRYSSGWKGRFRLALKMAAAVIPVSDYCRRRLEEEHGIYNSRVIHNGVDVEKFKCNSPKEPIVLTVAFINKKNIVLKGLEDFLRAASLLPRTDFFIAGDASEEAVCHLKSKAPANLRLVEGSSIPELYRRAKVYVQASVVESFGLALAEAMACECVPVATERGALPEVAGPEAIYTEYGNPEKLAEAISRALTLKSGKVFRQRIIDHFSLEKREEKLIFQIRSLHAG